jgi:hypothetical protein
MVQRSDEKGDKRSPSKSSESEASRDAESNAAKALRERIRQAGAAATARASDHAPPENGLLVPNSSAPASAEHSGVRTRPPEPRATNSTNPPLFAPPRLTPGAMAVPWPAVPRRRELQQTRDGLGAPTPSAAPEGAAPQSGPVDPLMQTALAPQAPPSGLGWSSAPDAQEQHSQAPPPLESGPAPRGSQATPRGFAPPPLDARPLATRPLDTWSLSTARTQPMPRVRTDAFQGPPAQKRDDLQDHIQLEAEERRRAELATTRKTQGLLRAPDASGSSVGRYSVHDVSTEYVDTGAPDVPDVADSEERSSITEEPITEEVPALDASAAEAEAQSGGEPEVDSSRPRRSTPKQRVGHRRSSRPEMGHARERGTKRTDPGIRARTLRGGGAPLSTKTAPQLPAAKTSPLPAANPNQPAGSQSQFASTKPGTGSEITHRSLPLPGARSLSARPPPLPSTSGSIVIDPSLSQPSLPAPPSSALTRTTSRQGSSSYVPLPRDREAYEAFLRSAAGEHGGPPRARPSWAQQETALIPRDALEPPSYEDDSAEPSGWPTARTRALVGVVLIALSAGVGWWILEGQTAPPKVATPLPLAPAGAEPTPASRPITLIATEPTGAELLLDRAVIGNTPLEVARPSQGESLYIIRLRGFEQQMVRITSTTHDAIHITLTAAPEPPPPAPPARTR